jgi:hypothetical protein
VPCSASRRCEGSGPVRDPARCPDSATGRDVRRSVEQVSIRGSRRRVGVVVAGRVACRGEDVVRRTVGAMCRRRGSVRSGCSAVGAATHSSSPLGLRLPATRSLAGPMLGDDVDETLRVKYHDLVVDPSPHPHPPLPPTRARRRLIRCRRGPRRRRDLPHGLVVCVRARMRHRARRLGTSNGHARVASMWR